MRTVATCSNPAELGIVRSLLEAEGVIVDVPNESVSEPLCGYPVGYQVRVAPDDYERCIEILRSAGYGTSEPSPKIMSLQPPSKRVRRFRVLVLVDMFLAILLWVRTFREADSTPEDVRQYLESLAALPELWDLGYTVYLVSFGVSIVGSLLLLARSRVGLWLYSAGYVFATAWVWVFPGGIWFGTWSVIGTIQTALVGAIVCMSLIDRTILSQDEKGGEPGATDKPAISEASHNSGALGEGR